jgi:hypothetical protein
LRDLKKGMASWMVAKFYQHGSSYLRCCFGIMNKKGTFPAVSIMIRKACHMFSHIYKLLAQ